MLTSGGRKVLRSASLATAIGLGVALSGCAANRAIDYDSMADRPALLRLAADPATDDIDPATLPAAAKMTLAQVAAHAVAVNPDVGIARAQAEDAKAQISVSEAEYGAVVSYGAAYGRERTYAYDTEIMTPATRSEASISLSQPIFDFGKTYSDVNWAKALKQSSGLRRDAKTLDILNDTITAYLAVLELDLQIANAKANIAAHQKMYGIVELNEQGGNGTAADLQKAQTRLDAAKSQTLDLQAQRRTAASQFERVTGWTPGSLQVPSPPVVTRTPTATDIASYAESDPLLLSYKQDKLSLEAQISALQASYLPQVSLEVSARVQQNVGGRNPATAAARAMLSVQGTLYDGGDKAAKIIQLRARMRETDYRYKKALDNLGFDLGDASRVLATAGDKMKNISARIASGQQVVELYSQQFESGTRTIFELLDAQQELSAARSEQITARFDVLRAKYHQLRLTGELAKMLGG